MNFDKAHEQYDNDATFHALVNTMENAIHTLNLSPSEIRAAAMFACWLHEMNHPSSMMVHYKDWTSK